MSFSQLDEHFPIMYSLICRYINVYLINSTATTMSRMRTTSDTMTAMKTPEPPEPLEPPGATTGPGDGDGVGDGVVTAMDDIQRTNITML